MLGARDNPQILWTVVCLVAIAVVNNLTRKELATEHLNRHKSVLTHVAVAIRERVLVSNAHERVSL
jgi:hypothetical protein